MIYPIVKFGNPVLEKPAAAVTVFDDDLKKLVDDMFESMYAAHGVGLAAPQIGITQRIAVIWIPVLVRYSSTISLKAGTMTTGASRKRTK